MSAVMDNSVPLPPSVADSVTTGTPSPMKQTKNALMDALFKNLTRLFAFLVFILLAAIFLCLIAAGCIIGGFVLGILAHQLVA